MTSADTPASSYDSSFAEPRGWTLRRLLAPFAIGLALLSAFLTFVVLTGLTPIEPTHRVVVTFLMIDASVFRSGVEPEKPDLEWGDGVSEDPTTVAQTSQLLRAAEAASTETLVRMNHPDWDDDQVTEEVAKIRDDQQAATAMSVPGPDAGMGLTGPGTSNGQLQEANGAYGG